MSVYIIGAGMGDTKALTCDAAEKTEKADIIIASSQRLAKPYLNRGKRVFIEYEAEKTACILRDCEYGNAVVLYSGDASFFSGARELLRIAPDCEVIAGVSCVSYFCAKIGVPYDNMNIVSMHGRQCNIVSEVRGHKKTFLLLGENPCGRLLEYGLGGAEVYIGENLSYADEKISHGTAAQFRDTEIAPLSVIVIVNEAYESAVRFGIDDCEFVTGGAPMTKSEARAVSVSKLKIAPDDVCLDVGAGTGSVSVEMALLCPKGRVYAIEKNAAAAALVRKNAVKFKCDNIEVIEGGAPDVLDGLPRADKVFIGGSSGRVAEIIEKCGGGAAVVNAITLETLNAAVCAFKALGYIYSVTQISAARTRAIGGRSMLTAQNPVFIIYGEKQ